MSVPKRLAEIVRLATDSGWTYDVTRDGHPRLTPPAGTTDPYRQGRPAAPITFASTPSDVRGDKNAVAYLRRVGVDIPHKGQGGKKGKRGKQ